MIYVCLCAPLSPGFTVCVSEWEGANGWKSFILARVWQAAVSRSADVARSFPSIPAKGVIPFHVTPISINSLGKEEDWGGRYRRKCISCVSGFSSNQFLDLSVINSERHRMERATTYRGSRLGCRAAQTTARRKVTTNMPDCGRRAPDRLLSSLAMWPQWAGESFFHSTSFPCHTERKRAADVWETALRAACLGRAAGPL